MFDSLGYEDFKDNEKTEFKVLGIEENVSLELEQISEKKTTDRQEMFSLLFKSPLEYYLPQGTYRLQHERLGEGELFIVPIEKAENSFIYQAVFNRLVKS